MTGPTTQFDLPTCVEAVLKAAERLHDTVFSTPFPELDSDPEDQQQLDEIIAVAVNWGQVVNHAYGSVNPNSSYRDGLLGLFPNQETATPSLERAADLLGAPPSELQSTVANMSVRASGPSARDRLGNERGGHLDTSLENWPRMRQIMTTRYQAGVAQSLLLVGWARSRVEALQNALIPTITEVGKLQRDSRRIEIRQAGASRTVTLTGSEATFLRKLAENGKAETLRITKMQLVDNIPEIRAAVRSVAAGRTPNHAEYEIDDAFRAVISVPK